MQFEAGGGGEAPVGAGEEGEVVGLRQRVRVGLGLGLGLGGRERMRPEGRELVRRFGDGNALPCG